MTVARGTAGNNLVLNGKLSQVNAEEAYTHLTTPCVSAVRSWIPLADMHAEPTEYSEPMSSMTAQTTFSWSKRSL